MWQRRKEWRANNASTGAAAVAHFRTN